MVLLDAEGRPVRNALLWNDNRSAPQARELLAELGGPEAWARATGLVPVASFTMTKLRWVAEHEPANAARADSVLLPHDWLTHMLRGGKGGPTTDRGEASGTGYWSATEDRYRPDLLRMAFGRDLATPRVAGPHEPVGQTPDGVLLAPGTGDNMAAALGLGLEAGDVAVSLGTSGTVFSVSDRPTIDPTGIVAGFADASGKYLPLVATLNAARVLGAAMSMAGRDLEDLDELALSVEDSSGLVLLPFLDGERTPPLPDASGLLHGLTRSNATPARLARAAVEGMLCGLADAVDALEACGIRPRRVVLLGGAARSRAVQQVAAGMFALPVVVPAPGEYVARGAARQAAWVLSGEGAAPEWPIETDVVEATAAVLRTCRQARASYRAVLSAAHPLLTRREVPAATTT
jgi:xylulokinase